MEKKTSREFVHEFLDLLDQTRKLLDSLISECERKGTKRMTEKEVKEQVEEICAAVVA